jgi:hypothetical protein
MDERSIEKYHQNCVFGDRVDNPKCHFSVTYVKRNLLDYLKQSLLQKTTTEAGKRAFLRRAGQPLRTKGHG